MYNIYQCEKTLWYSNIAKVNKIMTYHIDGNNQIE